MSDQNPLSAADADAVWTAVARAMAGEATPAERDELRREVDAHPERAALLAALDGALRPLSTQTADVDVEAALAKVMAAREVDVAEAEDEPGVIPLAPRIAARQAPPSARRPAWRSPALLRAAAAVALMIGAALLWRAAPWKSGYAPAARYATTTGARRDITLPDGSQVLLGPGSTLDVEDGYGAPERSVRLQGEAYFQVEHSATHPFTVHTAAAVVRDLGTTFSVRTVDGSAARVVVTSGSVSLAPAAGGAARELRAGDRGSVGGGQVAVQRGAATAEDVAWRQGRLVFRDAPMAEVVADMQRWYGITLVVDPALAGRHLTAEFSGRSADQAVEVVAAAVGGQLVRRGDTAQVVPPGARAP